jgi:hypothetical protein
MIFFQKYTIASSILKKTPTTLSNWIKSGKLYPPESHPGNNGAPKYNILDALRISIISDGFISMDKMVTLISITVNKPESVVYESLLDTKSVIGIDFENSMKILREEIKSGVYHQVDLAPYLAKANA